MIDHSDGPLGRFEREHVTILGIAESIVRSLHDDDVSTARVRLDSLKPLLGPHAELEEQTLFAELRAEGELLEDVERLEGEHSAMKAGLGGLADLDETAWIATVERLMGALKTHIESEEVGLFPTSRRVLPTQGWEAVFARMETAHTPR